MARGRKPKPTHIKLLEGTARPDRVRADEPVPTGELPDPPSDVPARHREVWAWLRSLVDPMRVASAAEEARFRQLVAQWVEREELLDDIETHGRVYETISENGSKMFRARPEVAMLQDVDKRLAATLADFGLTPAARTKVAAREAPKRSRWA